MSTQLIDANKTNAVKRAHSREEPACGVCRGDIRPGAGRYRIGDSEYHPDCFRFWLTPLLDDATK
jgi:hypothetical protein